jgi:hypothetical protein
MVTVSTHQPSLGVVTTEMRAPSVWDSAVVLLPPTTAVPLTVAPTSTLPKVAASWFSSTTASAVPAAGVVAVVAVAVMGEPSALSREVVEASESTRTAPEAMMWLSAPMSITATAVLPA